jgi:cytidylate kinase
MYRAAALKVLRTGTSPDDPERVSQVVEDARIVLQRRDDGLHVTLDGEDVTDEIRTPAVTRVVSAVSAMRRVRDVMVREQRALGAGGGIVLEGRDIGTVVFPDADLKFFLVAGIDARARRRLEEVRARGVTVSIAAVKEELGERDRLDSTRDESPLRKADDAIELDTSALTIDQQVAAVVATAHRVMGEREKK